MREKILTYIERNSRVDLKDLAIMLGTDEAAVANEIADMEKEGVIGSLHHLFYATVGNGTSVASAKAFAAEYSQKLKADGVDAVILTST